MGGHPQSKTPNLKRLMQRGTTFINAHCNASICAPSRASLFSGLYPHTTDYYNFDQWRENKILKDTVMLQQHFKNNGYHVWGCGKLHHNGQEAQEHYHEFTNGANFGPFPKSLVDEVQELIPHPDMSELFDSDADIKNLWEQTFGRLSDIPYDEEKKISGWHSKNKPFHYRSDEDRDLMPDEISTNFAIEKIKQSHDKPFFMGVGFNRPHTPLYAPDKYFDAFPLESIQAPKVEDFDAEKYPEITSYLHNYGKKRKELLDNSTIENIWKKWIQAYLACIHFVDDQVGKILDALDNSPNANNTLIIFTSDNGYHTGDKGVLFKNTLWEKATRIPFIASIPGTNTTGKQCHAPISLVDLYPTLCDYCQLPSNPNQNGHGIALDGNSIRPLIDNPSTKEHHTPVITCIPTSRTAFNKYGPNIGPAHFSLRNEDHRFTQYGDRSEELYNYAADGEDKNLSENSILKEPFKSRLEDHLPEWVQQPEKPDWKSMNWNPLG
jgi:arylsulfatase A-like enzyme